MTVEIKGLKEIQKKLGDLSHRAKKIDGAQNITVTELLTPAPLSRCSHFTSVGDVFEASGFTVNSQEDFDAIPDD